MAHQIPSLGFSRGVPRKALHSLLKSSNASSSTTLSTYKIYYPSVKTHWAPGSTIYDHGHFDAAAYPGGHHHVYHAKPVDKYGYRVNRLPLVASYNTTSLSARPFVSNFIKRYSTVPERKKVAVVLSGCGVLDGTEIHEAVSVLVHLSRAGVDAKMFAPEKQHATVNHLTSNTGGEPRSVLEESARIARGKVKPLKALKSDDFSAIIFPGGYGAAKNLCNFAERGENMEVDKEVERIIKEFHEAKKPIGMLCVSPVIIAKLIKNVRVTVGNEDQDVSAAVKKLGGDVVAGGVNDVIIDENHKVITSPAYMNTAPIHKIFDGIGQFVEVVLGQTNPEATKEAEKKA